MKVQLLYLHLFNWFSVLFVKIRRELSKKCGAEMLFIDMFGHDVQQLSSCRDLTSPNYDVYLFAMLPDNAFHPGKSLHRQMKTVAR